MQLSRDELLKAYRTMAAARHFEDSVFENFSDGKIPGFVHLSAGQEATAAGVYMALDERDWIATTHRAHGQCIARGLDLQETMDEIYGATTGVCGGKGGSMHIADLDKGMLGANGIIGATGPLAVGAGLSARAKGENGVAVAFYGDGGSNQGLIFEAYNLANIWKLPVIFICEDNGYAEATPSSYSVAGSQVARANGFGMPAVEIDGFDFFAIHDAMKDAVERARNGEGPSLIHIKTARFYGHFVGDAQTYRADGEIDSLRADKDCLKLFREKVVETGLLTDEQLDEIYEEEKTRIQDAASAAQVAPRATEADLMTDVYSSY
ncbi:MAG: thiamine pyrophosphate-dependent dehydrogenase E1 component subunit alpha [Rhodospirillales bacterium]|nr:thiamine pyrophosphate-dependent dehydrogenase E1 component subunit alpha [Rhodospirillales bacterium]MDE0378039.1 thiamine pyrophosphate-dependent dehydrogenase E1 component subunit alpha [Rhodospirillales bacterium]